jgi:hypothetical protein
LNAAFDHLHVGADEFLLSARRRSDYDRASAAPGRADERRSVMSIRRALCVWTVAVATVLLCTACDSEPMTTVSGPSVAGRADAVASAGMSVTPTQIRPIAIVGTSCPGSQFVAPFTLGISGDGTSDVFVKQVEIQFVDRIGVTTPNRSISREALIERFGSTRVTAVETRTFPFEFALACTSLPSGTLTVGVIIVDAQQRERRNTMTMPVR